MGFYNVRVAVVELVEADNEQAAVSELRRRLSLTGFDPFEDDGDAFESERLDDDIIARIRARQQARWG